MRDRGMEGDPEMEGEEGRGGHTHSREDGKHPPQAAAA